MASSSSSSVYYPPVGFYFQVEFNLLLNASNIMNVNNLENTITSTIRDPANLAQTTGFNLGDTVKIDTSFQEVSGLKTTIATKELAEGGENRFKHQLPTGVSYEKLVLKRGLVRDSAVLQWCLNTISNFEFRPSTLFVKLFDENREPLVTWEVINAYPVNWSVGAFNAEQNSLVIEEMTLTYQYFNVRLN